MRSVIAVWEKYSHNVYYGFFELNKVIVNAPTSVYSLTPCPKSGFTRNLNGN